MSDNLEENNTKRNLNDLLILIPILDKMLLGYSSWMFFKNTTGDS